MYPPNPDSGHPGRSRPISRRIDLYEAVKYDIRLHGFRFIFVEFALATIGALAVAVVEFLHAGNGVAPLVGGIWFVGVALNCLAVTLLALRVRGSGTDTNLTDRRLHLYGVELVVLLLVPAAVLLISLRQWRPVRSDSRAARQARREIS